MEDRIQWINHKTKKILYIDYSNLNSRKFDSSIKLIQLAEKSIGPSDKDLLVLINFNDFFINDDILEKLKTQFKNQSLHVKKFAIIYNSITKKSIIQTLKDFSGANINLFSESNLGKNWLVE